MGLTETELRALQEAGSLDEVLALLESYISAGLISEDEADSFLEQNPDILARFGVERAPVATADLQTVFARAGIESPPPTAPPAPGISPEAQNYLKLYTSKNDLADRLSNLIRQGRLPDINTAARLYNNILGIKADPDKFFLPEDLAKEQTRLDAGAMMFIRAGAERTKPPEPTAAELAQIKAGTLLEPGTEFAKQWGGAKTKIAPLTGQLETEVPDESEWLATLTPEQRAFYNQKKAERQMALETIYGRRPDMAQRQGAIDAETARLAEQDRLRGEEQTNQALLRERRPITGIPRLTSINNITGEREYDYTGEPPFQRPPIPGARGVVEPFLAGIGYAPGTRLRSFIESEVPQMARDLASERQAWWERMNPEPDTTQTFEDVQNQLQAEAEKWQGIAAVAPTSETTANTVWGPGGLAGIANQAYQEATKRLGALNPADFGTRTALQPEVEEDPLAKALKRRNFLADYYKMPGTGTVNRLSRAVRFA